MPDPKEPLPPAEIRRREQLDKARRTYEVRRVRHLFADVVSFSESRSVEAQTHIVYVLNQIFRDAAANTERLGDVLYLPTGDGICASFLNSSEFDVHLTFALSVLRLIAEHNTKCSDEMRRFEIRIGLNENLDNIVQDINDRKNIAGAGITLAQRIMGMADGGQILVGDAVFQTLRYREKYMQSFKPFRGTVKHGVELTVYQVVIPDQPGLSIVEPKAFRLDEPAAIPALQVVGVARTLP